METHRCSTDIEWGTSATFPGIEGRYQGPEAMQEWMKAIRSAWEEFEVTLDEVLHDGGDVVVVTECLRGRGRGSDVEVEMRIFSAYWFEGGKIRRRGAFTEREEALEAPGCRSSALDEKQLCGTQEEGLDEEAAQEVQDSNQTGRSDASTGAGGIQGRE